MSLKSIKSALAALAVVAIAFGASHSALAAEEVIVSGSTTVLPVMQKAGEAFMAANPDITLAVSGGGSGNGIKALLEGLCQVAMSSRDIKSSEVEAAEKKGVKPVRTDIAFDALAPIVNPANPVSALTMDDLKKIYTGEIENWKELGGKDSKIVVISRDTSSGTYETWEQIVMHNAKVTPRALLQSSNGAVAQIVAKNGQAIGYVGFGYLNDSLKKVTLNGIEATADTALNKSWPISRELFIFTNGEPSGAVQKLVAFLLDPQKGQKAVSEIGFIPLPAKQ